MPNEGPAGAPHQPPPFRKFDALSATPEGRWETLKLLRLLKWLWRGTTGWPPAAANPVAAAYVSQLTTPGPLVTPPAITFPGLPPLQPYRVTYSDLLHLVPVRLSRVAEMLKVVDNGVPGLGIDPTSVSHINDDWFSDSPAAPHPFNWKTTPVASAETRETSFVDKMIRAIELSLDLRPAPVGDPANWPHGLYGGSAWPPLVGGPAPGPAALLAPIDRSNPLAADKPIDHFWDSTGGSVFRIQILVGIDRIAFAVTAPGLR